MAQSILDRLDSHMFLGAKVFIAKIGDKASAQESKTISNTFHPTEPTSYDDPGDWTLLGSISEAKVQTDYDTKEKVGVQDNGSYFTQEIKVAKKSNLQFSTYDIVPEALQISFGLKNPADSAEPQQAFATSNGGLEVWLFLELTESLRTTNQLATVTLRGKLSLQNPVEAKNDLAQAQYELAIAPNSLNMYTVKNLTKMQGSADE